MTQLPDKIVDWLTSKVLCKQCLLQNNVKCPYDISVLLLKRHITKQNKTPDTGQMVGQRSGNPGMGYACANSSTSARKSSICCMMPISVDVTTLNSFNVALAEKTKYRIRGTDDIGNPFGEFGSMRMICSFLFLSYELFLHYSREKVIVLIYTLTTEQSDGK